LGNADETSQFYTAIYAAVNGGDDGPQGAEGFFKSYLAFFVVIAFYLIGWAWKRSTWKKLADIDVDSGRREIDWEILKKERARYASWPAWRKVLSKFF
jgi:amino acid transporter